MASSTYPSSYIPKPHWLTIKPPPAKIVTGDAASPNPDFVKWQQEDQRALIILQSSLSEESMAVVLGLETSSEVWAALEQFYRHDSLDRMHTPRDSLRQLQKCTSYVSDCSRKFKALCDQLDAIGHPVEDIDKSHWFLCGLGSSFETFSTTYRAIKPRPTFRDLLSQAESHELFLNSVQPASHTQAAFNASSYGPRENYIPRDSPSASRGRGTSSSFCGRGHGRGHGRGRGRGQINSFRARTPHYKLCRTDGHYASACPDLHSYATLTPSLDANLVHAFHSNCNISPNSPD
ncbi:uncharacterized protein [Rutidosis leptorrhynchoides]|uniref:uncharacterized protein n=1 Tax=Rutidosis leptorrhynchoides TaxID=125765 RepID=UPI003A9A5216